MMSRLTLIYLAIIIIATGTMYEKGYNQGYRRGREATTAVYEKTLNQLWTLEEVRRVKRRVHDEDDNWETVPETVIE